MISISTGIKGVAGAAARGGLRWTSTICTTTPRVHCVVGSGAAGFYTAEALLLDDPGCEVHILDKLPVPFGLVRYGIAPDHQEAKAVETVFSDIGEHPGVKFLGNVEVGRDVDLQHLRAHYSTVCACFCDFFPCVYVFILPSGAIVEFNRCVMLQLWLMGLGMPVI